MMKVNARKSPKMDRKVTLNESENNLVYYSVNMLKWEIYITLTNEGLAVVDCGWKMMSHIAH